MLPCTAMPFGLINIIPKITTERALIAFICLLVGWLLVEFLRQRLRSDEKLIRASLPKERFPALKALLTHFDVDSESLAPEQRLQLALEQVRFKHSRDRGRHILWGLLLFLAATVSIFAINRAFPDLNQYAGIESGRPPVPAASPNALIGSNDSGSRGSGDRTVKLPFIVRAINPATLEEEPTTDVQMTVADLSNPVPVDAPRSGELFVVSTKETERTTIHTSASTGSYKIERTVVISGYTVSQMPCGQRVFYLPIRSTNITTKALSVAVKSLQEQTKCESIDRALVIWESLHELVAASGQARSLLKPSTQKSWSNITGREVTIRLA